MRRVSVLTVVGVAALASVTFHCVPGASAARHSSTSATFSLAAGHGFRVSMEAQSDQVVLTVVRRRQFAIYKVHGQVSSDGEIDARFGGLGRISVSFERESSELRPCREALMGIDGFFVGTISFKGERNYLRLDAGRAKGRLSSSDEAVECQPEADESSPEAPKLITVSGGGKGGSQSGGKEKGKDEPYTASLTAHAPGERAVFIAIGEHRPGNPSEAFFFGGKVERRGRMQSVRGASASTKNAHAFAFDDRLASATVRPPKPFHGEASFQRAPGGAISWSGSLSVPIFGGGRIRLTGRRMAAKLIREIPSD